MRANSGPYALYAGNGLGLIKVVKCSPQEELKDFQAVPDLESYRSILLQVKPHLSVQRRISTTKHRV